MSSRNTLLKVLFIIILIAMIAYSINRLSLPSEVTTVTKTITSPYTEYSTVVKAYTFTRTEYEIHTVSVPYVITNTVTTTVTKGVFINPYISIQVNNTVVICSMDSDINITTSYVKDSFGYVEKIRIYVTNNANITKKNLYLIVIVEYSYEWNKEIKPIDEIEPKVTLRYDIGTYDSLIKRMYIVLLKPP